MTRNELLAYCLAKPGAQQDEPWQGDVLVKVGGKIFVFLGSGQNHTIGLKCGRTRELADQWLARHPGQVTVTGYLGRYGWNNLSFAGGIPQDELLEAVDDSYADVVSRLPKRDRPLAAG